MNAIIIKVKSLLTIANVSLLAAIIILNSCDELVEPSNSSGTSGSGSGTTSGGGSGMLGNWSRNDGQAITYLNLTGSVAKTCNNGKETIGTFNSSVPNMTFVISGTTIVFPLAMSGDKLIVKVPAQGTANHVDTEYIKSTNWPCGTGTGTGTTGGTTGGTGGTTPATGKMTFYANSDQGAVTVVCNSTSKTFSGYYSPQLPPCGTASNAANFTLPVGSYTYTATGSTRTWSGTITISKDACLLTTLTATSGQARTGKAMFWTAVDMKCAAIAVTCGGSTKSITGYYSSGTPDCGAGSSANFDLNPGTYAWTAKCTSKNWSGTISVTADGCSTMRLTN